MPQTSSDSKLPPGFSKQLAGFCRSLQDKRKANAKGFHVLLVGLSPTQREEAAQVIAAQLHLTLQRVDLSKTIMADIGETEKNLNKLFAAAESAGELLFFDEADALFGKRNVAKGSHGMLAEAADGLAEDVWGSRAAVVAAVDHPQKLDKRKVEKLGFKVFPPWPS